MLTSTSGIAGADEVNAEVNESDTTPPESIANLEETIVGSNRIRWTWEIPMIHISSCYNLHYGVFATQYVELILQLYRPD
jgi:hypothetical protein